MLKKSSFIHTSQIYRVG